jgi:hypothetical protein
MKSFKYYLLILFLTLITKNVNCQTFKKLKTNISQFHCSCNEEYETYLTYSEDKYFYNGKECYKIYFQNFPYELNHFNLLYIANDSVFFGNGKTDVLEDSVIVIQFRNGSRTEYSIKGNDEYGNNITLEFIGKFQNFKNKEKVDTIKINNEISYIVSYENKMFPNDKIINVNFVYYHYIGMMPDITFLSISKKKGILFYEYYSEFDGLYKCSLKP